MADFLGVSRNTAFNYVREQRPIALFCEKYLSDEDADEFLETGCIKKLDNALTFDADRAEVDEFVEKVSAFDFGKKTLDALLEKKRENKRFILKKEAFIAEAAKNLAENQGSIEELESVISIVLEYPTIFGKIDKFYP